MGQWTLAWRRTKAGLDLEGLCLDRSRFVPSLSWEFHRPYCELDALCAVDDTWGQEGDNEESMEESVLFADHGGEMSGSMSQGHAVPRAYGDEGGGRHGIGKGAPELTMM